MRKGHWTFDHPSDIGLEAGADTLEELLAAMAEGLAGEICDLPSVRPHAEHAIEVDVPRVQRGEGTDTESLAVDFLTAVMNHIQVKHFMVHHVTVIEPRPAGSGQGGGVLKVRLAGEPYDPARHEIKVEIKAVTYHQLTMEQRHEGWFGRVILDI